MSKVATVIDGAYDLVIQATLRFIGRFIRLYFPETPRIREEMTQEVSVTVEEPDEGEKEVVEPPPTFKSIEEIIKKEASPVAAAQKNTVMYAQKLRVSLYRNPTVEFDSQVTEIPYGEMVMMLEPRGRFFRIVWNGIEGWVLKEDLADRAAYVYPEFTIGEENSIDSPNTAHVRAILGDPFHTRNTDLPLQAGEYVLYKLWKKGKRIEWPHVREARVPGLWHTLLRGVPRIHMGVAPKIGAIMEYMMTNDIGHLAYVEAVFPDDTITISEVNYPDGGIYNERVLTKEEWKELRPTFLTVG